MKQKVQETKETKTKSFQWNEIKEKFTHKNIIIGVGIFFILWIMFFDHNNIIRRHTLNKEKAKLEETKRDYQKKIKETNKEIDNLNNDEYIERIAREKHFMKKDNEDIYIVTE